MEFTYEQYRSIDRYCRARNLDWFVSCWDEEAVDFMEQFDTPLYKVASATLTDLPCCKK
jgi:N-acetylneuraminate synthase